MKKVIIVFFIVFVLFSFVGCYNSANENNDIYEESPIEENTDYEEYDYFEEDYCFYCGQNYENGYIVDVANQEINLCKPCRDELLVNNGSITVNNNTFYPFSNVELYKDDLVAIDIPNDYYLVDSEYGDYYKAQFNYKDIDGIFYLFSWEDMLPVGYTTSDRIGYSLSEMDTTEEGDLEIIELFAPEIEEEYDYYVFDIQGERYYFYVYYSDFHIAMTLKDGIMYTFTYFENIEDEYDRDNYSPYIDWMFFTSGIVYPTIQQIGNCLE